MDANDNFDEVADAAIYPCTATLWSIKYVIGATIIS